jgi:MFS family permease
MPVATSGGYANICSMNLRPPDVLRERRFLVYWLGQTVSALGSAFATVAVAFAVLQVSGSVAAVGLVLAATRLPLVLFVLVGGVVGDRCSRRTIMLACDAARFLTQGTAALLLLSGRARLWELAAIAALNGLAQAFSMPASTGLLPRLCVAGQLRQANAALQSARAGAALGGMLLGGVVAAWLGPGAAFAVDSVSFLLSALALASLRLVDDGPRRAASSPLRDLRDGWRELISRQWLWVGVLHISLLNAFALVAFFALGPVVAQRSLGGAAAWGLIGAGFALGMLIGGLVAGRMSVRRPLVAAFGVVVLAAPQLVLLALAAPTLAIAGAALLGGLQVSIWSTLWTATLQERVPDQALSRVSSYVSLGGLVLAPLGYAVVGPLGEWLGVAPVLWCGAVWIVGSTAFVVALPSVRAVTAAAVDAEAYSRAKTISWAPSQRHLTPSVRRFSLPSKIVRKWFPASCPTTLEKQQPP